MSAAQIAAFREAHDPTLLPPPTPLPLLPREAVLEAQRALEEQERALDAAGEQRTRRVLVGPAKAWSSQKLEELNDVGLGAEGGLKTDERAEGKVLVLRIISSPVRTSGANLVVEDRQGHVAPCQVYNLPLRWSGEELGAAYPLGSCWALKEPVIRSSNRGFLLRVDSPTDLVRLAPSHSLLTPPFPNTPATLSALEHKNAGNRLFTSGKSLAALDAYTLGLDALQSSATSDVSLHGVLLSNRAAVLLKLGRPGAALRDAQCALKLEGLTDALWTKVLYRAACASYALEEYDAAEDHLDALLKLAKEDPLALDLYFRLSRRVHEKETGKYDWEGMYELSRSQPSLDVASYVHPGLEVRSAKGKHRGLFTSKVLDPGELLFVQKPLAVGKGDEKRLAYVMGVNMWTESLDPYAMGEVVSALVERWTDEPARRGEIGKLWAGEELGFLENGAGDDVDISRLEAIATFNSFHLTPLASQESPSPATKDDDTNAHTSAALYSLPSYMNHACLGNVSYSFLGDLIFARARVKIAKGTELVDSYVGALDELDKRRENLAKHGFVCSCELCKADEEDGEQRRMRKAELRREVDDLTERIHSQGGDPSPHIARIRELVAALDASHAPSRGPLRPAVYSARRLLAQALADGGEHEEALREELDALRCLGAVFSPATADSPEKADMKVVPRVGDSNAVLSSLFIAQQCGELDRDEGEQAWVHVARRIERGQAGEELFELRYGAWAQRHFLDLTI